MDGDLGVALDRLHGEIGVSGVSLWVAMPPMTQFRAHDHKPRVFRTRGGLFLSPNEERYRATRCKPIVSSWNKGRDPFSRIAQACSDRGLELRAVVSAAATGRLAQRYPFAASKNAYGDASQLSLCLANADVQTYLEAMTVDLSSNDSLSGIVLADFVIAWSDAFGADLRVPSRSGDALRALLSTCFCESCQQGAASAGVDVAAAQEAVRTAISQGLEGDVVEDQGFEEFHAEGTPLGDYHSWRAGELSRLLRRLVDASPCKVLLDRGLAGMEPEVHEGLDLSVPDAVITCVEQPDGLDSARCPAARRSEIRLAEAFAGGWHGPELVKTLTTAAQMGFSGVQIDNYGLLPETALTSLKQAIRFARRTATDQ